MKRILAAIIILLLPAMLFAAVNQKSQSQVLNGYFVGKIDLVIRSLGVENSGINLDYEDAGNRSRDAIRPISNPHTPGLKLGSFSVWMSETGNYRLTISHDVLAHSSSQFTVDWELCIDYILLRTSAGITTQTPVTVYLPANSNHTISFNIAQGDTDRITDGGLFFRLLDLPQGQSMKNGQYTSTVHFEVEAD